MTTTQIVILVLVLLVVAAIVAALMAQATKRKRLKSTFGPEYDRTVESSAKRREAERELAEREERRRSLDIRPLAEQDRMAFTDRWRSTQEDFVDHPEMAVRQADLLVAEVMSKRGYPVGDFDQMSRDVSVDHAHVVDEYRAAHDISELNDRKQATTEQLRQAMVHYRALFTDLLGDSGSSAGAPRSTSYDSARDDGSSSHDDASHVHDSTPYRDDDSRHDDTYAGERTTSRDAGYASDADRRFEPVDTSRAEGVRVERGGLGRGQGGTEFGHDLPRDDRPRT